MRGADQRFPMTPFRALFTVTHRNESGTGRANRDNHKTLILCKKSATFFSNVIGVPTTSFAQRFGTEVVAGAAECKWKFELGQEGQQFAELDGVFSGKLASDPRRVGIVDRERRLNAGQFFVAVFECGERGPELLRMRAVLGVVDDDKLTAGDRQADV